MLWAWNVVFVCNTESIFLCVSTSEAEPPLLHITTLTTAFAANKLHRLSKQQCFRNSVVGTFSCCYRWSGEVAVQHQVRGGTVSPVVRAPCPAVGRRPAARGRLSATSSLRLSCASLDQSADADCRLVQLRPLRLSTWTDDWRQRLQQQWRHRRRSRRSRQLPTGSAAARDVSPRLQTRRPLFIIFWQYLDSKIF